MQSFISVDPIALYDPIMEVEHYLDGQHNGGYFNPRNTSVYGYCYQNPVLYVDPNGKQSIPGPIRGIGDGIARSVTSTINETNEVIQPVLRGIRNVARDISTGSAVLETTAGVSVVSSGGATSVPAGFVAAVAEAVSTASDITSLIMSALLGEEDEIINDATNLLLPAVLNNTVVKTVKKTLIEGVTDKHTQDAMKAGVDVATDVIILPVENVIKEEITE